MSQPLLQKHVYIHNELRNVRENLPWQSTHFICELTSLNDLNIIGAQSSFNLKKLGQSYCYKTKEN